MKVHPAVDAVQDVALVAVALVVTRRNLKVALAKAGRN